MPANGFGGFARAGVARVGTRRTETPPRVADGPRARRRGRACAARGGRGRAASGGAPAGVQGRGRPRPADPGREGPVRSSMRPPAASPQTQHGVQCVSRTWRVIVAQAAAVSAGPSSVESGVGSVKPHTPQQMPRGRRVSEAAATERPYQPVAMVFSCWIALPRAMARN